MKPMAFIYLTLFTPINLKFARPKFVHLTATRPQDTGSRCRYTEEAVADSRQRVILRRDG